MGYAIFSDVQANLRAWEQVLADIRGQRVDVLACLGDVVGYSPKPGEVLRGIREVTGNFVMGNHDAAAAGAMDCSTFNEQAQHSIEWTIQALSAESREFLGAVPLAIDAEEILFVHAEISEPGRFMYIDSAESAEENFVDSDHFVTFVGHTHHPNLFQLSGSGEVSELPDRTRRLDPSSRYIVKFGSVGEPRNSEDLRGVYVIYDSETREVNFRRVPFDIEACRSDLDSTSLEVKPFFLQSYDHKIAENQTAVPSAAHALVMEAPAMATVLVSRQRAPICVAGTRSGAANDGQGWHVDIRPRTNQFPNGQMCFFYDNGPEIFQALSEDVVVGDLEPHHFAVVWDHDASAVAGEMRLYLDGDKVVSTDLTQSQIPAGQANAFRIGALTNPPKVGLDEVRFSHAALEPLEFLRTETQSMTKNGKWGDAANWSAGEPPSGTQTAVVGAGVAAEVAEAPPEYSGDLVLRTAAKLTVKEQAFAVMPDPPAKLVLHQGAALIVLTANNAGGNKDFGPIELAGNATIWGGRSTSGHHTKRLFFGEISGPGALIFNGVNNNEFVLGVANTFQGGFIAKTTQNHGFHVRAKAAGSLGEGKVEIAANASLMLDAPEAIAPQATLAMTGAKDSRSPAKVVLNADNTVAGLIFDGEKQVAGTWGAPGSGADHEHATFSGSGILTVKQ